MTLNNDTRTKPEITTSHLRKMRHPSKQAKIKVNRSGEIIPEPKLAASINLLFR